MEIDRLNHMFGDFFNLPATRSWVPAVDIYETDAHEFVIKAELPAIKREDISVTFENNVLTVKGVRKAEQHSGGNVQRLELTCRRPSTRLDARDGARWGAAVFACLRGLSGV